MRIEIIGIWDDKIYSIGKISINKKGDVYIIYKYTGHNFHASRHVSGEFHWKFSQPDLCQHIWHSTSIDKFKGIEQIGSLAYGPINSASLSRYHHEYKIKKQDQVCEINLGDYQEGFNLTIFMLTHEGIPALNIASSILTKRQVYLYTNFFPMIGIIVDILKSENLSA